MRARRSWTALLVLAAAPGAVAGQGLAEAVERVGNGVAGFAFDTRPGVEICARGIRMGENRHMMWDGWDGYDDPRECRAGPLEVEVTVRDGVVRGVEVVLPRRGPTPGAQELGSVAPEDAVSFLTSLARGGGVGRAARDAVLPMMLADVTEVWRPALAIARDGGAPRDARKAALFWVGQEAAEVATAGLAEVARDDPDQEVREAAVFALSQRPADEGVPLLMELAETADQPGTRRTALFWLAQSGDDRVVAFFEEILLGRRR